MKYIFSFLLSLVLGICLFFGAVIGVSSSMITESSLPETEEILFEGNEISTNGWDWHLPLIGGKLDKKISSAADLTVQKLGTVNTVEPRFSVPDWVNYGTVRVEDASGNTVFSGTLEEYNEYSYPANGEYKVTASFWHLPHSSYPDERIAIFEESKIISDFYWNSGVETPAQATGYYSYSFRFTLNATAILNLSAESAAVGSVVALQIDGVLGDNIPTITTDLGDVTALPFDGGYRAYLPITYNAAAGEHAVSVTVGDEVFDTTVTVTAITHEKVALLEEEYSGTAEESEAYRTAIWALYTQESTEKAWMLKWVCPVSNYDITVDFGNVKYYVDQYIGYSNCVVFATEEDSAVVAPAAGTVVYAGYLGLTGNTLVIDHGHGVRTYLYGLSSIAVSKGDVLIQNQTVAAASDCVTLDIKIGNKSVSPWQLFSGQGGLFWEE